MKKGVPVSPGVAVAKAHCVDEIITTHVPYTPDAAGLSDEVSRFEHACAAVIRELDDTIARVPKQISEEQAGIFRAHRQLLRDPPLAHHGKARLNDKRQDSATALRETLEEYAALFRQIPDPYLQERLTDLKDVVGRVLAELSRDTQHAPIQVKVPVLLVAHEILPSQAAMIDKRW